MRNVQTQRYHISSDFVDRVSDLRSWTVNQDMLEKYPEFSGHIPISNRIPTSLWSFANKAKQLPTFNHAVSPNEEPSEDSGMLPANDSGQTTMDGTYVPLTSDNNDGISMLPTQFPKWLPQGSWYGESSFV